MSNATIDRRLTDLEQGSDAGRRILIKFDDETFEDGSEKFFCRGETFTAAEVAAMTPEPLIISVEYEDVATT